MSKMYKVVFNRKEVLVESNKVKTISKNKSEMNIIADDVLDCLSKAKELFFNQFNYYAKSVEVVPLTSIKDQIVDLKVSA